MKVVYVAGKYSAENEYEVKKNVRLAEDYAVTIWKAGHAAICPHLNTSHWGTLLTHKQFLDGDKEIIRRCDAVFLLPNWKDSDGARQEYDFAIDNGIKVFDNLGDLLSWLAQKNGWKDVAADESGCEVARVPSINPKIVGLSKDAPVCVNEKGGKQSYVGVRCDLFPPKGLLHISEILKAGAEKYGEDNWKNVLFKEHINHALMHIFANSAGDTQDDHIGHAACRMMMALEVKLESEDGK